MVSAIGLELWSMYAKLTEAQVPNLLNPVFWVTRFALAAHFTEGLIAACYAPSKQKHPIQYGIYTFWVGTVGLVELLRSENRELT